MAQAIWSYFFAGGVEAGRGGLLCQKATVRDAPSLLSVAAHDQSRTVRIRRQSGDCSKRQVTTIADISNCCKVAAMATHAIAKIGLGVLACVVAGSAAAVLHYEAHAPQFVVICAIALPAIAVALAFWKKALVRLFASIGLAGVAYFSALWVAIGVFHDGP